MWNTGQTGAINLNYTTNLTYVELENRPPSAGNSNLVAVQFTNCANMHYVTLSNCALSSNAMEAILASLWANSTNALKTPGQDGYSVVALNGNGITTPLGYEYFTNIQALIHGGSGQCTIDWPPLCYGDSGSTTQDVTFVTFARAGTAPSTQMEIDLYNSYNPTNVTWHWGDTNATDTGAITNHTFQVAPTNRDVYYTNYVRVNDPSQVQQFGTTGGEQHVFGVYSVSNFTQLYKLFFYQDSLSDLSLAGCPSTLLELHLADTTIKNCDQWFADTVVNCTNSPVVAHFWYPTNAATSASITNITTLSGRGWRFNQN